MCPGGYPISGPANWRSAFLPGVFQGTYIDTRKKNVDGLVECIRHPVLDEKVQREQFELMTALDRKHLQQRKKRRCAGVKNHQYGARLANAV